MDEEIERLLISVRADTKGFASDVDAMRGILDGPLGDGMERAGQRLENTLSRALMTGKFGFEDLRKVALSVLNDIANAAIKSGIESIFGGGGSGGAGGGAGGLLNSIGGIISGVFGAPGRATGGPVSPGRAYRVGERGPELFVPTSSGRIETGGMGGGTNINLTIRVSDNGRGTAPDQLRRASRHVARDLRQIMERA